MCWGEGEAQAAWSVVLETTVSPHDTMTSSLQPTLCLRGWEPTEQATLVPQDRSDIDSKVPFIISLDEILESGTVAHSSNPSSLELLGG